MEDLIGSETCGILDPLWFRCPEGKDNPTIMFLAFLSPDFLGVRAISKGGLLWKEGSSQSFPPSWKVE